MSFEHSRVIGDTGRLIRMDVERHDYLSTACGHGQHLYCSARMVQEASGQVRVKTPSVCKFCDATCLCNCHCKMRRHWAAGATADTPQYDCETHGPNAGWPCTVARELAGDEELSEAEVWDYRYGRGEE